MKIFKKILLNIVAYLILLPILLLPLIFTGVLFGSALYIFDKKNKGLGFLIMKEFENIIYNPKTVQECVEEAERLYSEGDIRQIRELENDRKEIIYWNGDIKYDYFTIKYVPKIFDNSFEKLKALEFRHQIWKFKNGDASVVKCNLQESSFLKEDESITKGRVYICGKKLMLAVVIPKTMNLS